MRLNRIAAYIIGFVALALPCFIYIEFVYMLGFPDGFITELGYAERRLAYVFIGISLILGLYFIYLGWLASRKEIGKQLAATIFVYLVSIVSISLIDYSYRLRLIDSAGG